MPSLNRSRSSSDSVSRGQPAAQPSATTLLPRRIYPLHAGQSSLPFTPAVRPPTATPSEQDRSDVLAVDLTAFFLRSHRIAPNVPASCLGAFNSAIRTCLDASNNDLLKFKLLHILPVTVLRHQPDGSFSSNELKHRLNRFISGEWRILLEEAWHNAYMPNQPRAGRSSAPPPPPATRAATTDEPSEHFLPNQPHPGSSSAPPPPAARAAATADEPSEHFLRRMGCRASTLAQHGQYSKALRSLESNMGIAKINATTVAQLRALHPQEHGFKDTAWDEDYFDTLSAITAASPIAIDASDVCKAATTMDFKSAGGPSGLRISHLRDSILSDSDIAKSLAALFERTASGANHSAELASLLGDCRLIALSKPDGGVRPIAIGESSRRLLGKILVKKFAQDVRADHEPLQVGVGTPDGGIAVIHSASAFLALNPNGVLINIDIKNAFNSMSRVAMFEHYRQHPKLSSLVPILRLYYMRTGNLLVHDGGDGIIVHSNSGSQQGCNFGTQFWSGGFKDALVEFKKRTNYAVSFADDGSFGLADPAAAAAFLRFVADQAAEHGCELNYSKCNCLSNTVLPNELRSLGVRCIDATLPAAERGVSLLEDDTAHRGITLQGVPIGTPEFIAAWLDKRLIDYEETFRRLRTYVPDRLAAAQILSLCIVPKISHILRALPPSITAAFAKRFDDACVSCFTAIAAPDHAASGLPPIADAIVRLKLRDGGFDIGNQHRACTAAYVASWATAEPLITKLLPSVGTYLPAILHTSAQPQTTAPALFRGIADAISDLPPAARDTLTAFNNSAAAAEPNSASSARSGSSSGSGSGSGSASGSGGSGPGSGSGGSGSGSAHARARAAGTAAAETAANDSTAQPATKATLQARLSRPSHIDSFNTLVNSLASTDASTAAKLRSQAGFLGTAWFRRLNYTDNNQITGTDFTTAIAIHLSLPLRSLDGTTCGCSYILNADNAVKHINACNKYAKLDRSETFQTAFDSIMQEVYPSASIEGTKPLHGGQKRCAAYASIPVTNSTGATVMDPTTGLPKMKTIIPDRVVRGFCDDLVKNGGRYIVDTVIVTPDLSSYAADAAKTPLSAAANAFALKYRTYNEHLKQGDKLLAVVCETYGGLHDSIKTRLIKWADLIKKAGTSGTTEFGNSLISMWQRRLSTALLRGRVQLVYNAIDKIAGVPARTNTAAFRITHPVQIARELGRPWAGW